MTSKQKAAGSYHLLSIFLDDLLFDNTLNFETIFI